MEENDRRTVRSSCGDQSRNLSLQWTFTTISRLATDMWMESALRDFCLGSRDPVDCMPIKMTILSMSQCLWESWTLDRDGRRADVPFAFFFYGEEKYLFTNLDSFCPVWICLLFLMSHCFFSFSSLSITNKRCSKYTTLYNLGLLNRITLVGDICLWCSYEHEHTQHIPRAEPVPKSSTYFNIGYLQILKRFSSLCFCTEFVRP